MIRGGDLPLTQVHEESLEDPDENGLEDEDGMDMAVSPVANPNAGQKQRQSLQIQQNHYTPVKRRVEDMQRAQQPMIRSTDNSLQNRGKYMQQPKGQML